MTLTDYAARWMHPQILAVHPRTRANYVRSFTRDVLPRLGQRELAALTRPEIRSVWQAMLTDGRGPSVVRNAAIALSACLSAAVDDGLLEHNPAHGSLRRVIRTTRTDAVQRAMPAPHLARFTAAVDVVVPQCRDLFYVMIFAGLRIGETLGLQASDIDVEARTLRVVRQWIAGAPDKPKGGRSRTVRIDADLAALLGERIAATPGYVWCFQRSRGRPEPPDASYVRRLMRKVCAAANLPDYSPHAIRHAYAVLLYERTRDLVLVKEQLGHHSVAVTERYLSAVTPPRPMTEEPPARLPPLPAATRLRARLQRHG